MRKPKFKRGQIIRLSRLLNMLYRPSEIAEEIGVTADTVTRSYLPAGAPHERDAKGNIWIHGVSFRKWAVTVIGTETSRIKKHPMKEGQAWCLKCNQVVDLVNPKPKHLNRYADMLKGTCAICGSRVNRTISKKSTTTPPEPTRKSENAPSHTK